MPFTPRSLSRIIPGMSRPLRAVLRSQGFSACCLSLLLPSVAFAGKAAAPKLEGFWDTPAGRVEIRLKGERAGGVLVSSLEGSALKAPQLVLDGTFFEDNLSAEVPLEFLSPACAGKKGEKAFALLLLTRSGKLTGGVSSKASCVEGLSSLTFLRSKNQGRGTAVSYSGEQPRSEQGDVDALLREGLSLMVAGRFEAARKSFLKATESAPGRGEAFNGVGVTHAMRREWGEAIDWYKRGLEAQPGFADLYYNLACAYAQSEQPKMAIRYLRLSVKKGWTDGKLMDEDPDLAPLRNLPEYAEVRADAQPPQAETSITP